MNEWNKKYENAAKSNRIGDPRHPGFIRIPNLLRIRIRKEEMAQNVKKP